MNHQVLEELAIGEVVEPESLQHQLEECKKGT